MAVRVLLFAIRLLLLISMLYEKADFAFDWPLSNGKSRKEQKGAEIRRWALAMESAVCALLYIYIARAATLIGMPMGSYLLGSRTGAQDSTLPLEGLDAVASRRFQL